MAEENIRINTKADVSGLRAISATISDVKGVVKKLRAEMRDLKNTTKELDKGLKKAAEGGKEAEKQIRQTTKSSEELTKQLKKQSVFVAQSLGKKELKAAKKEWGQLGVSVKGGAKNFRHLRDNVKRLNKALNETNQAGMASVRSIRALSTGEAASFKRPLMGAEKLAANLHSVKVNLKSVANEMQRTGTQAQWFGRQMMVGVTLPLGILSQRLLGAFRGVEEEYIRIAKVLQENSITEALGLDNAGAVMDQFGGKIAELGRKYGATEQITAAIVGDFAAMGKQLDSLNFGESELGAFTDLSLLLSEVGDMDVSSATGMITSLSQTFGYEIDELRVVLDEFNEIENNTVLRMKELADAFPEVAGAAKFLNLGVRETASIMAGMVASGFDATEAAHALKFGLTRMAAGENVAKEALKELNVQLYNSDGSIRDMITVLGELGDKFTFLNETTGGSEDQLRAMEDLFGTRQIARMGAALAQVSKEGSVFDVAMESAADSAGSLEEEMERIRNSFSFKWKTLKAEIQESMTDLGEIIVDPALQVMGIFKEIIKTVSELPQPIQHAIVGLAGIAAVAGPIVYAFGQVKLVMAAFLKLGAMSIPGLGYATKEMAEELMKAGIAVAHVGDGFITFEGRMAKYVHEPVEKAINKFKSLRGAVDDAAAASNTAFTQRGQYGAGIAEGVAKAKGIDTPDSGGGMVVASKKDGVFTKGLDWIKKKFKSFIDFFRNKSVGQIFSDIGTKIKEFGKRVFSLKKIFKIGVITAVLMTLAGVAKRVFDVLTKKWDEVYTKISPTLERLKTAWGELMEAIAPIKDMIMDAFSGKDGIAGSAESAVGPIAAVINVVLDFANAIVHAITWVIKLIKAPAMWIAKILNPAIQAVIALFNLDFKKALAGLLVAFYTTFRPIFVVVDKTIEYILKGLGNMVAKISDIIRIASRLPFVGDTFKGIADDFDGFAQRLYDEANDSAIDKFDKMAEDFRSSGKKSGRAMREGVIHGIGPITDNIGVYGAEAGKKFADSFDEEAAETLRKFTDRVYSEIDNIIGGIKDQAIESLKNTHEQRLKVFDDEIKAIDDLERKEQELADEREYLAKKQELLVNRQLQISNYNKDRALAIYEGRVDDARMLDLEEKKNARDHGKSVAELEKDRQDRLTKIARDAERERINVAKDALAERLKIEEDAFKKQLDLITKYTPLNVAQFNNMMSQINGVMLNNGVKHWPGMAQTGMKAFQTAAAEANRGIIHDAQRAGFQAANVWLEAFMSGEARQAIQFDPSSVKFSNPDLSSGVTSGGQWMGSGNLNVGNADAYVGDWYPRRIQKGSSMGGNGFFKFHTGGPVGGKGDVPATLEGGEYVIKKDSVQKLGLSNLDQINQGRLPAKSGDGIGEGIKSGLNKHLMTMTNAFMNTGGKIRGNNLEGHENAFNANWLPIGGKMRKDFLPSFGGGGGIEAMAAHILGMFQGARVSSMHRPGAITAHTKRVSLHSLGRAVDISGPLDTMQGIFDWALANRSQLGLYELIYRDKIWNRRGLNTWPHNDHFDHVHLGFNEEFGNAMLGNLNGYKESGASAIKEKAKSMMGLFGWGWDQFPYLDRLIQKESSWNPNAKNPTSSAWGLFQFLDMHKKPGGYLPHGNNSTIEQQITGGFRYIKDRYGTPAKALGFHDRHNWYHEGGLVKMMKGGIVPFDEFPASLHKGEMVLPRKISDKIMTEGAGGNTYIHVDTFIGEEAWFRQMMDKYDIKIKKPYDLAKGGGRRVVSSYNK